MSITVKKLTKKEALKLINDMAVNNRMPEGMIEALTKEGWIFSDHYCHLPLGEYEIGIEFCIGDFCVGTYRDGELVKTKTTVPTWIEAFNEAMDRIVEVHIIQDKLKNL